MCEEKREKRRKAPAPSTYVRPRSHARVDPDIAAGKKLHSALPHSSCFLSRLADPGLQPRRRKERLELDPTGNKNRIRNFKEFAPECSD